MVVGRQLLQGKGSKTFGRVKVSRVVEQTQRRVHTWGI